MTPAERLRAAADLIERTGGEAPKAPWACADCTVRMTHVREHGAGVKIDAAWIALLGPDTAPILAAWLRSEAACQELGIANFNALAFADLILRGQP